MTPVNAQQGRALTRAERAVLELLPRGGATFRTAQDLHAELRARGERVGLTSVYRALGSLHAADAVDVRRSPSGEVGYRRCLADDHHHHLVCRACGSTVEIGDDSVERWLRETAAQHGFQLDAHLLELVGTCPSCTPGNEVS